MLRARPLWNKRKSQYLTAMHKIVRFISYSNFVNNFGQKLINSTSIPYNNM